MITVSNIVRFDNLPFDEYMKLPNYSHSFLRGEINGATEKVEQTESMEIGTLVDGILTSPQTVDFKSKNYDYAREIARNIKKQFVGIYSKMDKQVSYTADLHYEGFTLPVKGRLDFCIENQLVLDLKVTGATDFNKTMEVFGYNNQLWVYSLFCGAKLAYIMAYMKRTGTIAIKKVELPQSNDFWQEKIVKFGTV